MSPQQTIAHYRITSKLGEGGMGEVWRATDTKLSRDVAIKILPDAFAQDADRMARFTREAQVLASLNHPNIAAIYGVEERALVMELVPGPTLAERIAQGAIPLEEALPIARQIAEALEYAHERGVIHRDLKPANVKITPEERVKVLDFGLAKALSSESGVADPASSPTLTMRATAAGVIMGTAAYMSPEQAKAKAVDKRADIWSFGAVLLEMLTARQAFTGETISETLAAVLLKDADLGALPAATPAPVRRLIRRCLEKDPRRRLRDIGEARFAIEAVLAGESGDEALSAAAAVPLPPVRRGPSLWTGALLLALLVLAGFLWRATRPLERPLMRFSADLGPEAVQGLNLTAAISPDGSRLVYGTRTPAGSTMLTTRLLDQSRATVLVGTDNATEPFFSPDGQWIGFFADQKLKKISVQGGAAVTLCDTLTGLPRGASWGTDGNIIANLDNLHLFRVPETGGKVEIIAKPEDRGLRTYRWPQVLPGAQAVLVTSSAIFSAYEDANIEVVSLKSGQVKTLQRGGYFGRYLPSGHLIYVHQGTLFGAPFDLDRLETRRAPVPLLDDVAGYSTSGAGQLDFSQTGTLVYLSGKSSLASALRLVWMDSAGRTEPLPMVSGALTLTPRLSPDGKRLAFAGGGQLSIYEPQRNVTMRLTFDSLRNHHPLWMPDGKHVIFDQEGIGAYSIQWIRSDGSGQAEKLYGINELMMPSSISPDGRQVAFAQQDPKTGMDLWTLPLDLTDPDHPKPGKPEPFLREPGDQVEAAFSPDGRWIAYTSIEASGMHVFVRPFPGGSAAGKWQVSTINGRFPIWSRNGRELFYLGIDDHIMVADYTTSGDSFSPGKPRQWSAAPVARTGIYSSLDLAPDGKRFIVLRMAGEGAGEEKSTLHLAVLLNFFDELRRRVPVK